MQTKNNDDKIIKVKEGSKEKEYKLKCKFFSDETKKEYWIYTDDKIKNGIIELKVSFIENKDDKISLVSCTDLTELNLVVNMYEALKHRINIKDDGENHEN